MEKRYLIKESTLTDMANAIRNQTGTEDVIAVKDFANKISQCGFSIPTDELVRVVFHDVSTKPGGFGWINGPLFDENGSVVSYWGGDLIFEEPYYLSTWSYYTIEVDHSQSFYGADLILEETSYEDDSYFTSHVSWGALWVVAFYGSQIDINVSINIPEMG